MLLFSTLHLNTGRAVANNHWVMIRPQSNIYYSWPRYWTVTHYSYCNRLWVLAKSFWSCLTLSDPLPVACQAPLSLQFSRQEYWVAMPSSSGFTWPRDQVHLAFCLGKARIFHKAFLGLLRMGMVMIPYIFSLWLPPAPFFVCSFVCFYFH